MAAKWLALSAAREVVGSLGYPSKMPGTSYGIPTAHCKVGSLLKRILGSTCAICYADETKNRGNYRNRSVRVAQEKRFSSLSHPDWARAMASALLHAHGFIGRRKVAAKIKKGGRGYHRWHDSGDLQSLEHLVAIVTVARLTPRIRHWLPTRESGLVHAYRKAGGEFPPNLCVRVSATMIDGAPSRVFPQTSTVHKASAAQGYECPAPKQGNFCGPCRACWSLEVPNTSYHLHS